MSTVGFIGLGTMGRPMAKHLIKAGHEVVFYARRPEVIEEFTAAGATSAPDPAAVAQAAEVMISIVTADAEVREVALGHRGLIEGASPGKLYLDMSTISPATTREVGAKLLSVGIQMLDAPVSGGPWGAEAAELTIMVGGEADDFARAQPILAAMGKSIHHVGPLGAGQTVKLVNQLLAGSAMALIGEGLVLAKAAGVDLDQLLNVLAASSGNSAMLEARGRKFVLANNYVPGFKTELMRKDVGLALELGRHLDVPMPLAAVALQQYTTAMNLGHAAADFAAVVKVCELEAGVKLLDG
ncbi:MAG: NAD(P)-dependent oxidoreductase [Pirellulales bacterium]|nr:NAD(P)-dependent oxidoreductase [Pirellulales bacterium]